MHPDLANLTLGACTAVVFVQLHSEVSVTQGSIWDQTTEQQQQAAEENVVSGWLYEHSQHTAHGAACSSALSELPSWCVQLSSLKPLSVKPPTSQQNSSGLTPHQSSSQLRNGQFLSMAHSRNTYEHTLCARQQWATKSALEAPHLAF